MRILQISSARSIGGGERHLVDLSNGLSKRSHDVFAAVVPGSPLMAELSSLPPENITTLPLRNALDISSAVRISRFVRSNKIELIHAHLARDYPIAAAAARLARVPFVITRHVLFPMNPLHRTFLRRVSFVIAPSNAVADALKKEGIFPAEKIVTIRHGIDVERFGSASPVVHDGFRIGAVGNLDPVKGFDILIQAAAIVHGEDPSVTFEIVGDDRSSDSHNRKQLEALIEHLGLEDVVRLSGSSDDIARKLATFDIFVSASRSESFGFAIAEAMLAGVPLIATETEGAKELIGDLPLGVLVPIDSGEALADAIHELLDDEMKRRQLSKFGRRHIEEHFSIERMVDATEKLYKRVIGS